METPLAKAIRLIEALEELARQQATILSTFAAADAARFLPLVERADPLVRELAALGEATPLGSLRDRIASLLTRLRHNDEAIAVRLEELRGLRARLDESRSRLSRVVPAYRPPAPAVMRRRLLVEA